LVCNPTKAANEVKGGGVFSNLGNSIAWWLGILLLNVLPLCPLKLPLHLFVVELGLANCRVSCFSQCHHQKDDKSIVA
jgi:hypothetical protein